MIDAITNTLYTIFGDEYDYYADVKPQNLKSPCFFVREINTIFEDLRGNYKKIQRLFNVVYIPKLEKYASMSSELEKVMSEFIFMDTITSPDGEETRIFNKNAERVDNEIVMTFEVIEFYRKTDDTDKMESLDINQEVG